jgi:hypothetical protein
MGNAVTLGINREIVETNKSKECIFICGVLVLYIYLELEKVFILLLYINIFKI